MADEMVSRLTVDKKKKIRFFSDTGERTSNRHH